MARAVPLKSRTTILPLSFSLALAIGSLGGARCWAQSQSDASSAIRGIVINSVTHEPIGRALVSSPDHRFAALTDSEGRFEFAVTKVDTASDESSNPDTGPHRAAASNRPYTLMARKPGFLTDPNQQANNLGSNSGKELSLALTPEAVIAGTVALPTSEA